MRFIAALSACLGIALIAALIRPPDASAMRNPSAVYCEALGYDYVIEKTEAGEKGFCRMPDGLMVSAWEFLQGEVAQKYSYCARKGLEMKTVRDWKTCSAFWTEKCAVCVLEEGRQVEVTRLMDLSFAESICGDGTCAFPENPAECPQDCPPAGQDSCEQGDSGALDIEDTRGKIQKEVEVPVRIQSSPKEIKSFGFEVLYDPEVLEFSGFEPGDLTAPFTMLNVFPAGTGRLRAGGLTTADPVPEGASGYLIRLRFRITSDQENASSPLYLENLADDIELFSKTCGLIFVIRCDGDLNDDGIITPKDALIAFQCYLGSGPCSDCADVNQDGRTTPGDALCLLLAYLGKSSCIE